MHDKDSKRFIAAIMMSILFVGLWLAASGLDYIQFKDTAKVRNFLVMTASLWIGEVFLTGVAAGTKYSFSEHGLQLTTLSVVSLITLGATSNLTGYANSELQTALAVALALMGLALYLAVRKRDPQSGMPWHLRALSLIAGIVAVEVYVLVCLSPEITKWSL